MKTLIPSMLLMLCSPALAEQYIITSKMNAFQPATFLVSVNGRSVALMHNVDSSLDITSLLTKGKNTVTVTSTPGKNANAYAKSVLTVGAGSNGRWKTLYNREVKKGSTAGSATYVFMATPDAAARVSQVNVVGKFNQYQPAEFQVKLNGENVATIDSDGNSDLTGLLRAGKNTLTVSYTAGKNANRFAQSVLTVGEQRGTHWNSVVKWAVGKGDTSGTFTFPIYH